jgi:glycosyltransferase involved in cell wall biosynthesis
LTAGTGTRTPHIGLNLLFLVPGETGGLEVYARELLPPLTAALPQCRFTAFVNRETVAADGPWREMRMVEVPVRSRRRAEWVIGEQLLLPRLAARTGVDLVHSLGSTAPGRGRFARVVTIHDLNYVHLPKAHFGIRSLGIRLLVPLAARTAHRVIVPSQSTAIDVARHLRVDRERMDVVPYGLGATKVAPADEGDVRRRLGLGNRRVLLSVSAKRPHKNLGRLVEALALVPDDRRPLLVIPGYRTPHEEELRARSAALGLSGDVLFLGWLPSDDIEALYRLSEAFIFPSMHEGGGLPVLEAMARGIPTACSNRSAMPEYAGDAAVLFDPVDPTAIAEAIERLLGDADLGRRLSAAGPARAAQFSWETTARGTAASYRRALELSPE